MSTAPPLDRAAWACRWRRLNVGDKALLCLGLLTVAVGAPSWHGSLTAGAVASACALLWARVPVGIYLRAVAAPAAFIAIGVIAVAISIGHDPTVETLWRVHWLSITVPGVEQATVLAARGLACMAALILLAATTPLLDLVTGLRRLRIPDELIEITSLIYRYVFLFTDTASRMHQAQTGRLGTTTLRRSFHSAGLLAANVLVRSWNRARRMEAGLAGRGFTGSLRTWSEPRPHSLTFLTASTLLVLAVAGVAWSATIMRLMDAA